MMHTFKRITLIIIVNICKFLPVGVCGCVMSYITAHCAGQGQCRLVLPPAGGNTVPGPAPLHHGPRTLATPTLIVCHQERESSHGQHSKLDTDWTTHFRGSTLLYSVATFCLQSTALFMHKFCLNPNACAYVLISTRCSQNQILQVAGAKKKVDSDSVYILVLSCSSNIYVRWWCQPSNH